jgi:hypothetical protein
LTTAVVRAFLDLSDGGTTEVGLYNDVVMTEYFGEFSSTSKSFLITSGRSEAFKEFAGFCAQWMLLQSNPTVVTKVHGSMIIASRENRDQDWATITSTALVREVTANRKNRATVLAYWLGMFYTPPLGKDRLSSRQKDTAALPPQEEDEAGRHKGSAKEQAPVVAPTDRVRDPAKGKWPEEVQPKKNKKKPVQ